MAQRLAAPKHALGLLVLVSVLLGGLVPTAAAADAAPATALSAIPVTVQPNSHSAGVPSPYDDPAYRAAWRHTPRLIRDTGGEQHAAYPSAGASAAGWHVSLPDVCPWVSRHRDQAVRALTPAGLPPGRAPPEAPRAG